MIHSLLTETVTVLIYGTTGEDRYGNPIVGHTAGGIYPARLEQLEASEWTTRETTQVTEWRLFLPDGATIGGNDRVEHAVEGVFEVVGEPARRTAVHGIHHIEARLRRIE